mgnify:CR=1 FL=1
MSMDKSEIIKMVLELYSARKEAKEYLDFYAEPNEGQKLEEYKHIIREEFYPSRNREPKTRFSVCRKALSDFKKLKPSEDSVAELMVFYMENACSLMTMETCGSNSMILLRVISTRHCATSCFMTFGTSMIPESSNAFVGQALVDGDFLTH